MKTKTVVIRITEEQDQVLLARTRSAGFQQKSDYVRFSLFMKIPVEEKIDAIYQKVVKNG
jgi:hypothetical protein